MKKIFLTLLLPILFSQCNSDNDNEATPDDPRLTQLEFIDFELGSTATLNYSYNSTGEIQQIEVTNEDGVVRRFEYSFSSDGRVDILREFGLIVGELVLLYESEFNYSGNNVTVTRTGNGLFVTEETTIKEYAFENDRLTSVNTSGSILLLDYEEERLIKIGDNSIETSEIANPLYSTGRIFAPELDSEIRLNLRLDPISQKVISDVRAPFDGSEFVIYSAEITQISADNLPLEIRVGNDAFIFTYD